MFTIIIWLNAWNNGNSEIQTHIEKANNIKSEKSNPINDYFEEFKLQLTVIFNRPGVARAVLPTPSSFIH